MIQYIIKAIAKIIYQSFFLKNYLRHNYVDIISLLENHNGDEWGSKLEGI